jgi:hypothetical protein
LQQHTWRQSSFFSFLEMRHHCLQWILGATLHLSRCKFTGFCQLGQNAGLQVDIFFTDLKVCIWWKVIYIFNYIYHTTQRSMRLKKHEVYLV